MLYLLLLFQVSQATVTGVVRGGEARTPLVGAVVALPDLNRTTTTDASGRYSLTDVPAGPQHITVRFIGHTPHTLHALVPPRGTLEINVALKAEPYRLPTLTVQPSLVDFPGLDGTDSSIAFPDRSTTIAAVRNHPLLSEPDAFQALSAGEVVMQPETPSGVHIRGGATDQTGFLLDGIPVFNPYHAAGVFSAWNPDALATLHLTSSIPNASDPNALSGTIAGATRAPGSRVTTQGGLSTTQARITVDGPLGIANAGFLVSLRTGLPATFAPGDEASYLQGETGDWLAKLELPALGGRLRVLGYGSDNETDAASVANHDIPGAPVPRNSFGWASRSFGAEWVRGFGRAGRMPAVTARILAWSAGADAAATWSRRAVSTGSRTPLDMSSRRRDLGVQAILEKQSVRATTTLGARYESSNTAYRVASSDLEAQTPVTTISLDHTQTLAHRLALSLGASLAAGGGSLHPGPRAQLRWKGNERLTVSGSYARTHQFAQSLRNAESVVATIFPADLFIGAGREGVPVARSDQVVLAAEYRPAPGIRVGAQAWTRDMNGLLLTAPATTGPFAEAGFTSGSGSASGISLDATATTRKTGFLLNYGYEQVRLEAGQASYAPEHAAAHRIETGVIFFPGATSSIRLGITGAFGRTTSEITGGLEWEACNLIDRGCEFGGTPEYDPSALGASTLPGYLRIDLGVRKHWHLPVAGRDALVGLFATVTNVVNQRNVLTWARDPLNGQRVPIEMRPLAPLVVGLDWRF